MPRTLLVIGGGGYIGSTVTFNALTTTDMNVIVFDKLMYGGSSLFQFFALEKRFTFVHGDVRMGIPASEIEGTILTHCHADHDGGPFTRACFPPLFLLLPCDR